MARKNNTSSTFLGDVLPKERLAKSSQEMLIEGAASMSGQIVKNMAKDLRDGGMQKTKKDKKDKKPRVEVGPPKPKTRSYKLSDKKAEIKVGKPVAVGVIKKSTNKMKKESAFKMKGFSGFGNSPTKQKEDKYPMLKPGDKESRSDTVLAGSRRFPGYENLNKENKKKIKDATDRLGGYTPSLKEVYRQFKGQ